MIYVDPKNVLADYPAYEILEPRDMSRGYPEIHDEDQLAIMGKRGHWQICTAGSIVGSAVRNAENVMDAIARAMGRGEKMYWINLNAVCITDQKQEKKRYAGFFVGDRVIMEGKIFEIQHAPNDNFSLVEIEEVFHILYRCPDENDPYDTWDVMDSDGICRAHCGSEEYAVEMATKLGKIDLSKSELVGEH